MTDASPPAALLELDRVSFTYGVSRLAGGGPRATASTAPRAAVENVSLSVDRGAVAVLLGPNGAGKSTLLRLAAGLLASSSGKVTLGGRDVGSLERREVARQVALVPQHELPAAGFTVRDVVAMGRTPHQVGWMRERDADTAAIEAAMARCDLASLAPRLVETLSGGEQRRVAVARALAAKPRVLLLDEPAAFLDVRHRIEQGDLLAELAAKDGIACVVSMHDLDAAARVGTHALLLREGRVVAAGAPKDVMTAKLLRATFDADVEVGVHAATGTTYFVPLAAVATAYKA